MPYYGVYANPRSFMHYGIKKRSGRYPYGSGERPYQDQEPARAEIEAKKAEKRAKRKETMKKIAQGAYKAAWTGVAVALKVVASTAITSATLAGIGAAGFQFIQSPQAQAIISKLGIAAGNILYRDFVAPAANEAALNIDNLIGQGLNAIGTVDPGTPDLSSITAGTKYLSQISSGKTTLAQLAIDQVKVDPAALANAAVQLSKLRY